MRMIFGFTPLLLTVTVLFLLSGCSVLSSPPSHVSIRTRLSALPVDNAPLQAPVEILWDQYQIPMVRAAHDQDAAFALGMVHAHLRLGQMEIYRRVVSGRLSEVAGPFAVEIDEALRLLNLRQAVPVMRETLNPETRSFIEAFVAGINFYRQNTTQPPFEEAFLNLADEPWSVDDVLGISRLAGAEVNWLFWFRMLSLTREPHWPEFWARVQAVHSRSQPSFDPNNQVRDSRSSVNHATAGGALGFLGQIAKTGSNSMVVSGSNTTSGSALIANDPHVGLQLPNLWLVAGLDAPSYNAVGFMFPGVPGILLGRNQSIAWGGTNMLSLTSSLYQISSADLASAHREPQEIAVRWWFDESFTRRTVTIDGVAGLPVITDAAVFDEYEGPPLALRWRGYEPSDEIGAFLRVMRAKDWNEFRAAFTSYAVSGQNFLYADRFGNIGQLMAVSLPIIPDRFDTSFIIESSKSWRSALSSAELPSVYNPNDGYLVSANNQPFTPNEALPRVGMFYFGNDRVARLSEQLSHARAQAQKISLEDLSTLQNDTFSRSALEIQTLVLPALEATSHPLAQTLRDWNGSYTVDSQGATTFTAWVFHLASALYTPRYGENLTEYLLNSELVFSFLIEDLKSLDESTLNEQVLTALDQAARSFADEIPPWGEFHAVALQHPFGNIPILGRRFRYGEIPGPGASTTVLKTFAGLTDQPHTARYGANSRHLSDLSDPDLNYFVLLGGQDGFFGSENFMDQVSLWREGKYVQVPLRFDTWNAQRAFVCTVSPQQGSACRAR